MQTTIAAACFVVAAVLGAAAVAADLAGDDGASNGRASAAYALVAVGVAAMWPGWWVLLPAAAAVGFGTAAWAGRTADRAGGAS